MQQELATIQQIYQLVVNFLVNYSFQLAGAVLIMIGGFVTANWVARTLLRVQERRNVDVTLRQFIASSLRLVVLVMFVIIALGKLGISMTPLIAALGGLAVGASLAIQGPVSNYGAGLVLILTRMFKVGDTIEVNGCSGVVTNIELSSTRLRADDGEDIIIPNKHIVGEIHRNSYTNRLVAGRVGIDPGADGERAIAEVDRVLKQHAADLGQSDVLVGIDDFTSGTIVIGYRYWAPSARYFAVKYAVNNDIHRALRAANIHLAGSSVASAD